MKLYFYHCTCTGRVPLHDQVSRKKVCSCLGFAIKVFYDQRIMCPESSSSQDLWVSRPSIFNKEREYKTVIK